VTHRPPAAGRWRVDLVGARSDRARAVHPGSPEGRAGDPRLRRRAPDGDTAHPRGV